MGRLIVTTLVVAAAGIAVLAVNGPGKNTPEPKEPFQAGRVSAQVSTLGPDGTLVTPGQPAEAPAAVGATIVMKALQFQPAVASLRRGQSVRFVNKDDVAHTIVQDFGPRSGLTPQIDTPRILPGEAFTFIARADGQIDYICTLHPTVMSGQLNVTGPNA
jgi:plastocyanin